MLLEPASMPASVRPERPLLACGGGRGLGDFFFVSRHMAQDAIVKLFNF